METMLPRFLRGKPAATAISGFIAAWVSVAVIGDVTIAGELAQVVL